MNLRELRMWHWSRVESYRKSQEKYELLLKQSKRDEFYNERQVKANKRMAEFHMSCVNAFNTYFKTSVIEDIAKQQEKKK